MNNHYDIPLFKIFWNDEFIEAVSDVIKRGMNWAIGSKVEEFEKEIANYIGSKYAVTFNSGTSALHAILLAYNIKNFEEVIVPSFSFIATANMVIAVGGKPVFADIEEDTLGLDPEDVKERISHKTKAIITVHYGGSPSKVKELREIADDHSIILIEDAAEAFGARINNEKIGTFGDSSAFSFCQNKIITTGEGGAVVTNDRRIFERLRLIRSHGRIDDSKYFTSSGGGNYVDLGFNWRLSNILAALGLVQMKYVDLLIKMRRQVADLYINRLSHIPGIVGLPIPPQGYYHVYQLFTIRVDSKIRDQLIQYLSSKGITTKIYFSPIHLTNFYKKKFNYKNGYLPVTERVSQEVVSLPMYPTLKKDEIEFITNSIKEFLVRYL